MSLTLRRFRRTEGCSRSRNVASTFCVDVSARIVAYGGERACVASLNFWSMVGVGRLRTKAADVRNDGFDGCRMQQVVPNKWMCGGPVHCAACSLEYLRWSANFPPQHTYRKIPWRRLHVSAQPSLGQVTTTASCLFHPPSWPTTPPRPQAPAPYTGLSRSAPREALIALSHPPRKQRPLPPMSDTTSARPSLSSAATPSR